MDFGRGLDIEGVSFDLPKVPARTSAVLGRGWPSRGPTPPRPDWLRLGGPVWSRKDWIGKLYPRGTSEKRMLAAYGQALDAIELNATFYRVPDERTIDGWAEEVPAAFHFCPKLHQRISHTRAIGSEENLLEAQRFAARFARLGPRLGPAFLQLPPWLGLEALGGLDRLLAGWPAGIEIAVEMRHSSFFHRGAIKDAALRVLEDRGAAAVITDAAGRRDVCHASLPVPIAFVRFAGNLLHPTDGPRLDAWIQRLAAWRAQGLERAYFFIHQPDDALAPETMALFAAGAERRGLAMRPLKLHGAEARREPEQTSLFPGEAASGGAPFRRS